MTALRMTALGFGAALALASAAQAQNVHINPTNGAISRAVKVPAGSETLYVSGITPRPEKPAADALTRQRESVRKQAASAAGSNAGGSAAAAPADSFFTVPWPTSLVMPGADCDPMPQKDLDTLIRDASQREKLKPDLIQAVITQESGAKPCAVSAKGAMGLMQLMPEVAEQMHVADPFDPKESVDAGVKLLKQLIDKYKGNTTLALSAYNAGEKRVDQAGGIPDIPETQNYVKSISREAGAVPASSDPPSPR